MRRALIIAVAAACGGGRAAVVDEPAAPPGAAATAERWYRLAFHGAPVGWAVEREAPARLVREEHVELRRGDAFVITDLTIEIEHDDLAPRVVRVRQREGGRETTHTATRTAVGWRRDGEARPFAPADAIPTELVPLRVRRDGKFRGPVIVTGWDLAPGDGVVIATGPGRLAARMTIAGAAIDAAVQLDADKNPLAIADSTGVAATRVDRLIAIAAFTPPDVIEAGSIELPGDTREIVVIARATAVPPPLPHQRVVAEGDRWRVSLAPSPPPPRELDEIAREVAAEITPTLGTPSATAGDCTTYALAFAARARAAGVPVKLVTGYVLDGHTLVRHRWALARTRTGWHPVDASAPGQSRTFFGIALHDDDPIALAAAAVFDLQLAP